MRFRSHQYVTNVITDPATARYRIARTPTGHVGAIHRSPAARERVKSPAAPTTIVSAVKGIWSMLCPQRFVATDETAAHVAERTIASIGRGRAGPPPPRSPREMRGGAPQPHPLP